MTGLKIKRLICAVALCLAAIFTLSSCDSLFIFDIPRLYYPNGKTLVSHYLDVGQGDSIFIELPNGETMLIDSGENYHGASIIKYIEDCGRDKIDYLVGTHPHSDHIGSMAYIVRNFDIGSVYLPNASTNTYTYEKLLEAVKKKKMKVKNGKAGVNILSDEENSLYVNIIAPVDTDVKNLNNTSIIIKIEYGETSFLYTGDAETGELKTVTADVSADVLKVGHHGSDTSSPQSFIDAVNPKIAVISVGEDNDYGHPSTKTLKRLENKGCEIYRTDELQTIAVTSDGINLDVKSGFRTMERE